MEHLVVEPLPESSPALRAVLGFLTEHRRTFGVAPYSFMGRFDNGDERQIDAHRVDRRGEETEGSEVYLADVEGDLMLFTPANATALCASSATSTLALSEFRKAVPARWFLVL